MRKKWNELLLSISFAKKQKNEANVSQTSRSYENDLIILISIIGVNMNIKMTMKTKMRSRRRSRC